MLFRTLHRLGAPSDTFYVAWHGSIIGSVVAGWAPMAAFGLISRQRVLSRLVWKRTGRRRMILPVVSEL